MRQLHELDTVLSGLIEEHRKLLAESEKHQAAIASMNAPAIDASQNIQDGFRKRIAALEGQRAYLARQLGAPHKLAAPTLTRLADLYPQARPRLLAQRDELRNLIGQIRQRTHVAGKVAGAMLGHLNTVVRILAGAMQQAGIYTRKGVPKMAERIGVIEAVG